MDTVQRAPVPSRPAQFPAKLAPLFQPKRFKTLYGGRGAGRSWGVARALLIQGAARTLRILCVRELQNSIADSVHKVLSDQIELLGLGKFYDIQRDKITGKNGTTFSFDGIKNNTTKIKSYEGIDIAWVEEADKVSEESWDILIPTIRKEDKASGWASEIWMTFNPSLETDYTYRRFVLDADPAESVVVKMTYADNDWFPDVLRREMESMKARDYDKYLNVWEGFCIQYLDGVIFAKELRKAQESGRITTVPWHRETPVETFWDLGHRDHTTIWFAQRVAMEYRVLRYFEGSQEDIHYYLKYCQGLDYTYGTFWLPHDAKAKRLVSKRSIEEIIRASGRTVRIVPKLSITDGINAARIIFPSLWFDEKNCAEGLRRLRAYRFRTTDGQISSEQPLHDENSDGGDSFRYMALALRERPGVGNLSERLVRKISPWVSGAARHSAGQGWMNS